MAEPKVRIEGFEAAVDEALQDVDMAGGDDGEVVEAEDGANGDGADQEEVAQEGTDARTTFIEYVDSPESLRFD